MVRALTVLPGGVLLTWALCGQVRRSPDSTPATWPPALSVPTGPQRLSVTSLLVCHGLLMVGTSLGLVVALPVPRLQGIPKVTGEQTPPASASCSPTEHLAGPVSSPWQLLNNLNSRV